MSSSDELKERVLRRLRAEAVQEDSSKDITSTSSSNLVMLDDLTEHVHLLNSNMMNLSARVEARGHEVTELRSRYRSLSIDQQRVGREIERIKEIATGHAERLDEVDKKLETLYGLRPMIYENKAEIAKLEDHTNDLDARLDDEKRQRKESDSTLGLLILGLFFLGLVFHQKPQTQARKELTRGELAAMKAREWVQSGR